MNPYGSLCSTLYKTLVFNLRIILHSRTPRDIISIYQSCYHTNPVHRTHSFPENQLLGHLRITFTLSLYFSKYIKLLQVTRMILSLMWDSRLETNQCPRQKVMINAGRWSREVASRQDTTPRDARPSPDVGASAMPATSEKPRA